MVHRLGRSLLSRTSIIGHHPSYDTGIRRISWDQQQKRTFFSSFLGQSMSRMMSMKKITDALDGTSDERKKVEYIRALVAYAPKTAMQQIERYQSPPHYPLSIDSSYCFVLQLSEMNNILLLLTFSSSFSSSFSCGDLGVGKMVNCLSMKHF